MFFCGTPPEHIERLLQPKALTKRVQRFKTKIQYAWFSKGILTSTLKKSTKVCNMASPLTYCSVRTQERLQQTLSSMEFKDVIPASSNVLYPDLNRLPAILTSTIFICWIIQHCKTACKEIFWNTACKEIICQCIVQLETKSILSHRIPI